MRAERRVGRCRIDFVVGGRDSIEVKMLPGCCMRGVLPMPAHSGQAAPQGSTVQPAALQPLAEDAQCLSGACQAEAAQDAAGALPAPACSAAPQQGPAADAQPEPTRKAKVRPISHTPEHFSHFCGRQSACLNAR